MAVTRKARAEATQKAPAAPGGSVSPQRPGMVPDRSSVPGHFSETVPPATDRSRPIGQYGTAMELSRVYTRKPDAEITPADFVQATAASEELRKANPADLPPARPKAPAVAAPDAPEAIAAESDAESKPTA